MLTSIARPDIVMLQFVKTPATGYILAAPVRDVTERVEEMRDEKGSRIE